MIVFLLVFILLGVHLFLLFNLQFTAWPEMLSYPYLRNHGFLIYKDMIHPYPPILTMGLSWVYALFGYHLWVLQAVAWGVILASGVLIFLITKQITKSDKFALASLVFYVFLQPFLEGNMLWFDIAIVPAILLGMLFLLRKNLFLAGLFLAVAALTKQTAGLYLVFSILYLVFGKKFGFNQLKKLFVGPLILGIPFLVRLVQEGALVDFFNWVFWYPLTQWSKIIGYVRVELSPREILIVFLLSLPLIIGIAKKLTIFAENNFKLLILFLIAALLAVYPRFSFFHLQTALAILVILYGYLLSKIKVSPLLVIFYLLLIAFFVYQPVLALYWQKEVRFYGRDDIELAQLISERVEKDDKVFLLGLHSGFYVMADRLPPKRWTDNFGWYLEIPGVQEEILSRWEQNPPTAIFWRTPSQGNWFDLGTYQPKKIAGWIEKNYTKKEEIKPAIWLWQIKEGLIPTTKEDG